MCHLFVLPAVTGKTQSMPIREYQSLPLLKEALSELSAKLDRKKRVNWRAINAQLDLYEREAEDDAAKALHGGEVLSPLNRRRLITRGRRQRPAVSLMAAGLNT
jgi:hypothetical protein